MFIVPAQASSSVRLSMKGSASPLVRSEGPVCSDRAWILAMAEVRASEPLPELWRNMLTETVNLLMSAEVDGVCDTG
jgi:hypothetical protein